MAKDKNTTWTPFPHSDDDARTMHLVPDTAQTRAPAYKLAYADQDFMLKSEMRSVRIALELTKPELAFREQGIKSTVVLFGGARIPEPGKPAWAAKNDVQKKNLEAASRYYDVAREFAQLCSKYAATSDHHEFVIVTGGGPGVMEAGNRGAVDVGSPTIGLNIVLPHEQAPNPYVTPELCFNFHYFAMRKMHFLMRAKALAIFPGGFGTLDELFEAVTLIQTGRMKRVPVIMFGKEFWNHVLNIDYLADQGVISPDDVDLFNFVETAQEGWDVIKQFYKLT